MGVLRHLLIIVIIGVVFRWLWKSSLNERASIEIGRMVFPDARHSHSYRVFGRGVHLLFSLVVVRRSQTG